MQIYFKTRELARKAKCGKFVDNGKDSQAGKRFARDVSKDVVSKQVKAK